MANINNIDNNIEQGLKKKIIRNGIIGSLSLMFVTLIIFYLSNLNEPKNALASFLQIWYWVLILTIGFGTQVGLYSYIKIKLKKSRAIKAELVTSSAVSTGSMVACCAHNLVNLLPIIGISALGIFLVQFQIPFILLGLFFNLFGLTMMLSIIKKHELFSEGTVFQKISRINLKRLRMVITVTGLVVIGVSSFIILKTVTVENQIAANSDEKLLNEYSVDEVQNMNTERFIIYNEERIKYESAGGDEITNETAEQIAGNFEKQVLLLSPKELTDDRNFISASVRPEDFIENENISFHIAFNTHTVDLGFKLNDIAEVIDDSGYKYNFINWEGDPAGGHHRSGILIFEPLRAGAKSLKLTLFNVNNLDRVFEWNFF